MNTRNEQKKYYQFWLHNLPGIGDRTIEKLLSAFGSEKAIYEADEKKLGKIIVKKELLQEIRAFSADWDLRGAYERMKKQGITFLTCQDEDYPSRLKKLKNPPYGLYCLGNLPKEGGMAAAIIGARECSEYGRYVAEAFAGRLARAGVTIISGMARGIDGIAQQAAADNNGATFAVLGSGVDICYPASNKPLYEKILQTGGGILSVFPPGSQPQKRNFPERNRIVAGLADLLLVVEARQKSGTWITVDMALEQGKNIYAVPGRLTDRLSDGCNLLIRQGAGIALSPEDLLQEMQVLKNRQGAGGKVCPDRFATHHTNERKEPDRGEQGEGNKLLPFLDFTPQTPDELLSKMQEKGKVTELTDVLSNLTELCMTGIVKQAGGCYMLAKTIGL